MPELLTPEDISNITIISSQMYPQLGREMAEELGIVACDTEQRSFPNGELYARSNDNLRRKDVYIVASHVPYEKDGHSYSVNDTIMQSLLLCDAAVDASANEVTLIAPMLGYQRQDRKARGREAVGARVVRQMIEATGIDRVVTIDPHSPAVQSGYNIRFDQLTAMPELEHRICQTLTREEREAMVVVAPDAGAMKASYYRAQSLEVPCVEMSKSRDTGNGKITRPNKARRWQVEGRTCVIFDDMIDTGGTIVSGAESLKNTGASKIVVAATHAIFSDPALEKLQSDAVDLIFVSDTFPLDAARRALGSKLVVVRTAPLLAKAVSAIHRGDSVSKIFNEQNYR